MADEHKEIANRDTPKIDGGSKMEMFLFGPPVWRMDVYDGRWHAMQAPRTDGKEADALRAEMQSQQALPALIKTSGIGLGAVAALTVGVRPFLSPTATLWLETGAMVAFLVIMAASLVKFLGVHRTAHRSINATDTPAITGAKAMALPKIKRSDLTSDRALCLADKATAATSTLRRSSLIVDGRKNITESVALSAALYQYIADLYLADSMIHRDEKQATELLDSLERILDDYAFAVAQAKVTHHITIPLTGLDEDMNLADITDAIDQTLRINNQSQVIGRKVASLPPLLAVENPRTNNPQEDK